VAFNYLFSLSGWREKITSLSLFYGLLFPETLFLTYSIRNWEGHPKVGDLVWTWGFPGANFNLAGNLARWLGLDFLKEIPKLGVLGRIFPPRNHRGTIWGLHTYLGWALKLWGLQFKKEFLHRFWPGFWGNT